MNETTDIVAQAKADSERSLAFQSPQQDILAIALERGIDTDGLRDLMAMQKERIADQELREHARALAAFQGDIPKIPHNKKVMNKPPKDHIVRYTYADLDQIMTHIRPALAKNGLSVTYDAITNEGLCTATAYVRCGGAVTKATFAAPIDLDSFMTHQQQAASATKFAMRYAVIMALGLTSTGADDDDGQTADRPSGDWLLDHIQWVKANWESVVAIKAGIAVGDLARASECWFELSDEDKRKAWMADTKGGIFKKPEQDIIRSTQFREAHYGPTETKT